MRWIDDPPGEAAWNMALDEALLLGAEPMTLRLYGWAPHAVSLGYFQRLADFADLPPSTPLVRRLTGGGAIHHGDELTFALIADAERLPRQLDGVYVLLHDAIAAALRDVGIDVERLSAGTSPSARPHDRWCFATPGRHDLVATDRTKLCGSAQRRVRTATGERVLHHGSIVLRRPALTPFAAAVADRIDPAIAGPRLRRAVPLAIGRAMSAEPRPGAPTATELATAVALRDGRYRSATFLSLR